MRKVRTPQSVSSLDTDVLRTLLSGFTGVTGLNVVALSAEGTPLWGGDTLFECPLCRMRRGVSSCHRRTQKAARTAAATGATHVYVCHDDIVGVAVPLWGASGICACLCAGPAVIRPPSRKRTARSVTVHGRTNAHRDALPVMSEEKMNACAQLLAGAGQFALRGECPLHPDMEEMRLVIDLVRGNVRTAEEAQRRLAHLGRQFVPAIVFVADIDDFGRKTRGLSEAACQSLKEKVLRTIRVAVGENLTAMISGDSSVVIWGSPPPTGRGRRAAPTDDDILRRAMQLAEKARRAVREQTAVTVTFGVGRPHVGALEVHKSYLEAQSAVAYKRLLGRDRVIFIGAVEPEGQPRELFTARHWQELLTALRSGDRPAVLTRLRRLLAEHADSDAVHLKNLALRLVARAAEVAVERGLSGRVAAIVPFEFARAIEDLTAPADVEDALTEQLLALTDSIAGLSARWARERIAIARRYVEAHLASPLTLEKVCREAVHLSPSHFARAFKKQTGESFIQYLNRVRIERAQELLRHSDATINEISASVGYSSQHYFCKVFRRLTGTTPHEFRERCRHSKIVQKQKVKNVQNL